MAPCFSRHILKERVLAKRLSVGKRRLGAALGASLSIFVAIMIPTTGNLWSMCGMLLLCWNIAFTPGPSIATPLGEVYERARAGSFRTSTTSKLVSLAGMLLIVVGTYYTYAR